mmetsp:Transcript_13155/g.41498  ORF Transcript_13155/g.41498 Transcript_13155/m.41498 type:complete len:239 (-) Transcript_13155:1178-1894(-)
MRIVSAGGAAITAVTTSPTRTDPGSQAPWPGLRLCTSSLRPSMTQRPLYPHMQVRGTCAACRGLSLSAGHLSGSWAVKPMPRPSRQPALVASTLRSKVTPRDRNLSGHTAPRTFSGCASTASPGLPDCWRPVTESLARNCSAVRPALPMRMFREWNSAWKQHVEDSSNFLSDVTGCSICFGAEPTPQRSRMSAVRRSSSEAALWCFLSTLSGWLACMTFEVFSFGFFRVGVVVSFLLL